MNTKNTSPSSPSTITLLGAGGNMGGRISRTLKDNADYRVLHVEPDQARHEGLRQKGIVPVPQDEAVPQAEVIILAIADNYIAEVASRIVPLMKKGAMLICLDPAAPYAGKLPNRNDVVYFVTHPAHPSVFNEETDREARRDFFGSGKAKQAIVNALMQGSEEDYIRGEAIAKIIWQPVLRSHRITVEQMAILEPVLTETVAATCISVIREAMDESIKRGVPAEAARDFILGHINIELAILFNEIDWNFSAGAQQAMAAARQILFKDDWKRVFEPEELIKSVQEITKRPE